MKLRQKIVGLSVLVPLALSCQVGLSQESLPLDQAKPIRFRDRVKEIGFLAEEQRYRVSFFGKAGFYQVSLESRRIMVCLENSVQRNREVELQVLGSPLTIVQCD